MNANTTKKTDGVIDIGARRIRLEHDGELPVAVGRSRTDTKWVNKTMLWSELLTRLRAATRTQETHAEYMRMSRDEQTRVKDVGGFVGGTLTGGHRKRTTVGTRQIVALDVDEGGPEWLDSIRMGAIDLPGAWMAYSTHKHSAEHPRLRILLPLSREVGPDEYEAITRRIAERAGMAAVDPTCFRPSQMMFWGSCSRDTEYVFEYSDEPWTDPDKVLSSYKDWHDVSFWPRSPKEMDQVRRGIDKQGDPREKDNLIEAFCRTYTVEEAMAAFIPDAYTETAVPGRYTYTKGSTAGGMVIYEDGLFAYSHHSTDPAGGQLCNAFDLVRIHRYGARDEDTAPGTETSKLPSYAAMLELVRTDKRTIATIHAERRAAAAEEFPDLPDEEPGEEWDASELEYTKSGVLRATAKNLELILTRDPMLRGFAHNRMADTIDIVGRLPWKRSGGYWKDTDDAQLLLYLAKVYTEFPKQKGLDTVTAVAEERSYHPVLRYLDGLPAWDGVPRAETLLVDYLGAEDTPYVRAVTIKTLVGAVARVKRPGIKFDTMLVLCGPQGIGKSTLPSKLAGKWFSDSLNFADMKDKTAAEKLQGNWILEVPELAGMSRAGVANVRTFLSTQNDKYRVAYGRRTIPHPRQCVLIGTTNADEGYLTDTAGGRRFWPVTVGTSGHRLNAWDMTAADVAQIWAEALVRYDAGEPLILPAGLADAAEHAQLDAMKSDDRMGIIVDYLDRLLPEDWYDLDTYARRDFLSGIDDQRKGVMKRLTVCNMEVWCECFRKDRESLDNKASREVTAMLQKLGWRKRMRKSQGKESRPYGPQYLYDRPMG